MRLKKGVWCVGMCAIAVLGAAAAEGGVVTFSGTTYDDDATGFADIFNVAALNNRPTEYGGVVRMGGVDVLLGHAQAGSRTLSVADLASRGLGRNSLAVVFEVREPSHSPDVLLRGFTLSFYDRDDAVLFSIDFTGELTLGNVRSAGSGAAGWLFNINLTDDEKDAFFSHRNNRIGLVVDESHAILGSSFNSERFFIVPAPSALAVLGIGWAGFARRRR